MLSLKVESVCLLHRQKLDHGSAGGQSDNYKICLPFYFQLANMEQSHF